MTRDDLEQMDTASLRALARERLAGQARDLRTRPALIAALASALGPPVPEVAPGPPTRRRRIPGSSAVVRAPTSAAWTASAQADSTLRSPLASPPAPVPAPAATPPLVEEGFFRAPAHERPRTRTRPAPVSPARSRTPKAGPARPRQPPGDEVPHLLARDATTVFLFWDFRRDLERGAAFGLTEPHVLFRLYDGETLVRTVEAPLGRRSLYLEGLEPGHVYSVEAWFAGSDGHTRPTGRRSAPLRLAPAAPSARLEVEMVRLAWDRPLGSGRDSPPPAPPGPRLEPLGGAARVDLPASLDWRGGPGPGAGPGGPHSGRP
jgi:hypothetical protein